MADIRKIDFRAGLRQYIFQSYRSKIDSEYGKWRQGPPLQAPLVGGSWRPGVKRNEMAASCAAMRTRGTIVLNRREMEMPGELFY